MTIVVYVLRRVFENIEGVIEKSMSLGCKTLAVAACYQTFE